jgi:nucleotide-binding universal stress UspA family protein
MAMNGILVGVDGSGNSTKALEWAVREAGVRRVPLTALTVRPTVVGYGGYPGSVPFYDSPDKLTDDAKQAAQLQVDKVLAQLGGTVGLPAVDVRAVDGVAAEELLNATSGADMIVVGSRGAGGFTRLLMGSVAAQVTHHAHCPVVVIPADQS